MLLRIATRRSKLALAQSHWVKSQLEALSADLRVELREYVTRGDRIQDVPLAEVGGKGLFTKEIEEALLAGEADLAVHSLKDLPAEMPPGLVLAAVPAREDARDVVVLPRPEGRPAEMDPEVAAREATDLLETGARVGSSSIRRAAQLVHARPDLLVESVRGNVDTRLRKLDEGQYHALILAAAGLRRLGLSERISAPLAPEVMVPAPGQGALGIQSREDAAEVRELLSRLDHPDTRSCVAAERAVMDTVGGGCSVPLGAYARVERGDLYLVALVAAPDGTRLVRESGHGPLSAAADLGRAVAQELLAAGAGDLLKR